MIAIAGGITSLAHFREFCASPDAENAWQAPPEFPDLRAEAKALADSDQAFRSYRDKRVRAVLAMAPGRGPASAFLPESLERIDIPVAIVAGAANASGARFYAARIPHAELTIFPGDVGHYVFMPRGCVAFPALCIDAPGVDRDAIHVQTSELAKAFFARNLAR
jgi:predicted dienelactone hydrolase